MSVNFQGNAIPLPVWSSIDVAKEFAACSKDRKQDIRMYVLINSALPVLHAGIQASHAVTEFTYYQRDLPILKEWVENHKTLVFLSATLDQIAEMKDYFTSKDRKFASFKEPDLDNLETAVAFEPMTVQEGKVFFGKFKLYK